MFDPSLPKTSSASQRAGSSYRPTPDTSASCTPNLPSTNRTWFTSQRSTTTTTSPGRQKPSTCPTLPGVGIARYIRDPNEPNIAEAALAVGDSRQRKELGRILLQALIDAALENGIERFFRAYVSSSNQQVLESLTAIGATQSQAGDGMVKLKLPLPTTQPFGKSAMYAVLRTAAIDQARRTATPDSK